MAYGTPNVRSGGPRSPAGGRLELRGETSSEDNGEDLIGGRKRFAEIGAANHTRKNRLAGGGDCSSI